MNHDEIRHTFDIHPDMRLSDLAMITGHTIPELKAILREETEPDCPICLRGTNAGCDCYDEDANDEDY